MQFHSKKAEGKLIWIAVIIVLFYIMAVNQVEFNNKQFKTASVPSCKLIGKLYNPELKICVEEIINVIQVNNNATNATS